MDGFLPTQSQEPREAGARSPRLLMIDPGRRFGCDVDQRFSEIVARAFSEGGFEVVWVVDADDPLPDRPYAQLHRLLPLPPGRHSGQPEHLLSHLIGRIDRWAHAARKDRHSGLLIKSLVLVVWASVRVLYRLKYAIVLLAWCWSRISRVLTRLDATRLGYWPARVVSGCLLKIVGPPDGRHTVHAAVAGGPDLAQAELVELVKSLGPEDVAVLPSARPPQLDMLLGLLPRLGLSRPLPTTLHVRFAHASDPAGDHGNDEGAMLADRLRSGSPIRTIVLHAETAERRHALERSLALRVHECHGENSSAEFRRHFAPAPPPGSTVATRGVLDVPPSLVVERLGPVALLISALWGRVGSTAIFDAQTRYLLERGFIVVRILIDHHPQRGDERTSRLEKLLAENFEKVRPHLHLVASRDDSFRNVWRLSTTRDFRERSPVARIGMLLAGAAIDDPAVAAWCADRAALTVVNHLPHVAFAERLAKAPIVLETHDIFAQLLTTHGIPDFVPRHPDGHKLREADEADVWHRVAACVNLSPDDHAVVARAAKRSVLARPYVERTDLYRCLGDCRRPDVVAANRPPASYRTTSQFDIMLWGDWHRGNVAGVRWFMEQVAGKHDCLRQASILLVGRVAKGLPRHLLQRQGLYAVGFVDCIDDFFACSAVLVIPDQPGSTGTSVKAIDALARGCCFSSTAAGLRGVALGDTGLAPSNDPTALARDIARLLESPDARRERAAVAHRLYDLNFSKAAYSEAWDAMLHSLLPGTVGQFAASPGRRGFRPFLALETAQIPS